MAAEVEREIREVNLFVNLQINLSLCRNSDHYLSLSQVIVMKIFRISLEKQLHFHVLGILKETVGLLKDLMRSDSNTYCLVIHNVCKFKTLNSFWSSNTKKTSKIVLLLFST